MDHSLIVIVVLFALSVIASLVLFKVLDSFSFIEKKGLKMGGAIVGFIAVFITLRSTYFSLEETEQLQKELETKIAELSKERFDNVVLPEGYVLETSVDLGVAFGYPKGWSFDRFHGFVAYGRAIDRMSEGATKTARNFNVMLDSLAGLEMNPDQIFQSQLEIVKNTLPSPKVVEAAGFSHYGLPAHKRILEYGTAERGGLNTSIQYQIISVQSEQLITVTFTSSREAFAESKPVFEKIFSTFRVN